MAKCWSDVVIDFWDGKKSKHGYTPSGIRDIATDINGISTYQLWGNIIAEKSSERLVIDSCGWLTATTKKRLNAIIQRLGYYIFQKNHMWYIKKPNGDIIDWSGTYLIHWVV